MGRTTVTPPNCSDTAYSSRTPSANPYPMACFGIRISKCALMSRRSAANGSPASSPRFAGRDRTDLSPTTTTHRPAAAIAACAAAATLHYPNPRHRRPPTHRLRSNAAAQPAAIVLLIPTEPRMITPGRPPADGRASVPCGAENGRKAAGVAQLQESRQPTGPMPAVIGAPGGRLSPFPACR